MTACFNLGIMVACVKQRPPRLKHLLTLFACLALCGCGVLAPYQPPVNQGKQLDTKTLSQVQPGMTQAQVKYLLGTPNVVTPFDPNTWYYMYTLS